MNDVIDLTDSIFSTLLLSLLMWSLTILLALSTMTALAMA